MMKVFSAAIVIVAALAASASAADLNSMGFGSMQKMSDNDGLAIRGKGTSASVWGEGSATFSSKSGTATTANGYLAAAEHNSKHDGGPSQAAGSNLSLAGSAKGVSFNGNTIVKFSVVGSFGTSSAYAK